MDPTDATGKHVAILGLGPSLNAYVGYARKLGGRSSFCDLVWGINALGEVLDIDMLFHMDDVRVQQIRADALPKSNIAAMLPWLKRSRVPIMTSIPHQDYPATIPFPLAEALTAFPCGYFNSTAAYAVAYAILRRARKISCFGMDFTYPDANDAEKGRACVEFWLGIAHARGIELAMPQVTSLMDACYKQHARFYGYDCVDLEFARDPEGAIEVAMTPRAEFPTAEEIEERYDHSVHPNPLVGA